MASIEVNGSEEMFSKSKMKHLCLWPVKKSTFGQIEKFYQSSSINNLFRDFDRDHIFTITYL